MLSWIRPSVILGATVSCKEAAMLQSVFGSDGQIHLENQVSSRRFDLTTGEVKTVIPTAGNMSAVFGKDGVETITRNSDGVIVDTRLTTVPDKH